MLGLLLKIVEAWTSWKVCLHRIEYWPTGRTRTAWETTFDRQKLFSFVVFFITILHFFLRCHYEKFFRCRRVYPGKAVSQHACLLLLLLFLHCAAYHCWDKHLQTKETIITMVAGEYPEVFRECWNNLYHETMAFFFKIKAFNHKYFISTSIIIEINYNPVKSMFKIDSKLK